MRQQFRSYYFHGVYDAQNVPLLECPACNALTWVTKQITVFTCIAVQYDP